MRLKIAGAVLIGVLTAPVADGIAKKGDAQLVSRQSLANGGFAANDSSNGTAISANGRFAAFDTDATNLGGPIEPVENVYVYDRRRKRVTLVSRRSQSAGGAGADGDSQQPHLSANGRFVVFDTRADNLGGAGGGALDKIYVYDRKRRRVMLVSKQSKAVGGAPADGNSNSASISADGRLVAFRTGADNLGGPLESGSNVYVYDRRTKTARLVSRRSRTAGGAGHDGSVTTRPEISGNGRFVAFPSDATNLVGAAQEVANCYVYDRRLKRVELVSRRSNGGPGSNEDCANPTISRGGRFVAINTRATNLGGDDTPNRNKVYVYDRKTDRIRLVTRRSRSGPAANDDAEIGSISANGRFVGFTTSATNLGGPIKAGTQHSYVYDRKRGRARLVSRVSRSAGGGPANESSFHPSPSGDGRFHVFLTRATNLGGPTVMAPYQVYVFDLLGP